MKRIVICGDGTWNERDRFDARTGTRRPTNVTKMARAVLPRDEHGTSQVVYYHAGVGTGGPLDSLTGGAFGNGLEQNIREMYRFIAYNHEPGDELYLFGFSRGAYTVRSLAGLLHFAGLVSKSEDYYVPDLYRCYAGGQGPGSAAWNRLFLDPSRHSPRPRLQDRRQHAPRIRLLGVWDTVGSLGAPGALGQIARALGAASHEYHAVGLNPLVENAAHALAIDEHRKSFAPTLFVRGGWAGTLHQQWFSGVHSDVGGGYDNDNLANHALHWMADRARELGLALDSQYLEPFGSDPQALAHDSMSAMFRLMGPYERPIGARPDTEEAVHASALQRLQAGVAGYAPANLQRYLQQRR